MREEVDSGVRIEAPPRGIKKDGDTGVKNPKTRKPRASPKKNDAVLSGRVNKSGTPTKKRGADQNTVRGVKEEMESSASSMMEGNFGGSFDDGAHDIDFSFGEQDSFGIHGLGGGTDDIGDLV